MKKLLPLLLTCLAAQAAPLPLAKQLCDPAATGAHFPRTLSLLRAGGKVRILFYGQSITEQSWSRETMENLRKLYPKADLIMENRAIGGHSSQLLVKTAEADLYPFYPDLVVFHVYGDHLKYEDIIRRIRERTTAEILLQTDHFSAADLLTEERDAAKLSPKQWNPWMNHVQLPAVAKKYGAELLDVRSLWRLYLSENSLEPKALLKDGVHLNDNGCSLMAQIVTSAFQGTAAPASDDWQKLVTMQSVTPGDSVKVSFTGNRLDADVPATGAQVLIDGKPVSSYPGCWTFTKTTGYNGTNWPCLLRVQPGTAPLQEEEWQISLREINDDATQFKFTVTGSTTGLDGEGTAQEKFTSKSGRLVIEPEDWNLAYCKKVYNKGLQSPFDTVKFRSQLRAAESTTLAQGLPNGPHVAEITGLPGMKAARIFTPPLAEKPAGN
jgi:hypothetical protein